MTNEAPTPPPPITPEPDSTETPPPQEPGPGPRRLFRSGSDRMITGLAAGLARHFDLDPVIVRAAFVVLALVNGLGVVLYIIGSIIVPSDEVPRAVGPEGPVHRPERGDVGRILGIVFGLVLVAVGVGALIENVQGIEIDWMLAACGALIAVGVLLVVTLGRVARGGLVAIGIVLTVLLAPLSIADMSMSGDAFGDRAERPASVSQLEGEYEHAFGSLTVDLRNVTFPEGTTTVRTQSAFGSAQVFVPRDVAVEVVVNTAFGSVEALGQETSAGPWNTHRTWRTADYDRATRRLALEVSSAFGSVEVIR